MKSRPAGLLSISAADRRGLGLLCVLVALSVLVPGSLQADDPSHRQGSGKADQRPGVQAGDKIADLDDQHANKNGDELKLDKLEDAPLFVWFLVGGVVLFVLMWVEVGLAVICLMIKPLLDALPEEHRQLEMRRVWWLLLPPLMPFWNFYVFGRLSRSYASYHRSQGRTDSDGAGQLARGYCIVVFFVLLFGWAGGQLPHTVATGLLVAYFVKLYGWRKEIRNAANRRPGFENDQADPEGVTSVASVSDPAPADPPPFPRRHDLDALRSGAMLLGIALHASISFIGVGEEGAWAVQDNDTSQADVFGAGLWAIHGFRMQLFFVVSGFFTAMLWRRRGLKALLLHRAKRILVPCLVGVATIIPIVNVVGILAAATAKTPQADEKGQEQQQEPDKADEKGTVKLQEGEREKDDVEGLGDVLWLIYMVISYLPIFHHLWFLWYLCWLVAMFAMYAYVSDRCQWRGPPRWLITSPLRYLWLLPVTMVPQACMGLLPGASEFGPDTAVGFIPAPHILLYYAIFFGFGVLYFDCDDQQGKLGRWWPVTLLVTFSVVLPLALDFATGLVGWREQLAPASLYRLLNVLLQVLYTWGVTFGLIGAFRALLKRENKTIRYLSDSSYWLYVAHLPLVLLAQMAVRNWQIPAAAKFGLVCVVVTAILLLSYEYLVRYTLVGTMLNGRKTRPAKLLEEVAPTGHVE